MASIEEGASLPTGWKLVTAAHSLLNSERIANEKELLIATCVDVLATGPVNTAALYREVNDLWPGANISTERLESALSYADECGLIAVQRGKVGELWSLTKDGLAEVEETKNWFSDLYERLTAQIFDRATKDFGEVSREQAKLWANLLVKLFIKVLSQDVGSYAGEVEEGASGNVRPLILDGASILSSVDSLDGSETTKDFLKACVIAAIDETDSFGNELVGCVSTVCVLHAVISGRSRANKFGKSVSLQSQRIVIDTPILVDFLGSSDSGRRLSSVIKGSLTAGMDVIVPIHVLEELKDVIERVGRQVIPGLLEALGSGVKAHVYSQMVNDQVLALFVDACQDGTYTVWDDFAARAEHLDEELERLGVKVREHGNVDRIPVTRCEEELTDELAAHPNHGHRGEKQILRDAESMTLVWRTRKRVEQNPETLWPGAWLVTTDHRIDPAFRRVDPTDPHPLVLTPAQWATLVVEAVVSPDIKQLIDAAATFVRQETTLRIAVKYPPKIALELSRSLSGEATSETDLRVAQMTLPDMLNQTYGDESISSERLITRISTKRMNRMLSASNRNRDATMLERTRFERMNLQMTDRLNQESDAREAVEKKYKESKDQVEQLTSQQKVAQTLSRRRVVMSVTLTLGAVVAILFFWHSYWKSGVGMCVSIGLFYWQAREWTMKSEKDANGLFFSLIGQILTVYDILTRI